MFQSQYSLEIYEESGYDLLPLIPKKYVSAWYYFTFYFFCMYVWKVCSKSVPVHFKCFILEACFPVHMTSMKTTDGTDCDIHLFFFPFETNPILFPDFCISDNNLPFWHHSPSYDTILLVIQPSFSLLPQDIKS